MKPLSIALTTGVVAVVAGALVLLDFNLPNPPEWLTKWTTWAITFVALLKAPGFADALITRVKGTAGDGLRGDPEG